MALCAAVTLSAGDSLCFNARWYIFLTCDACSNELLLLAVFSKLLQNIVLLYFKLFASYTIKCQNIYMFCNMFEKTAISTGMIQGALAKRIGSAVSSGGKAAGTGVIRSFEAKTSNLAGKGMIPSAGQRSDALHGMVRDVKAVAPQSIQKPVGDTLDYSKMKVNKLPSTRQVSQKPSAPIGNVRKLQASNLLIKHTPYAEL
jgi:hypothetical protein